MKMNKKTTHQMRVPTVKKLYSAVAIGLMAAVSSYAQAADDYKTIGDLEIYQAAKQGSATIAMMLDVSGSMGMVDFTASSDATVRMVGPYSRMQYDGNINDYTCAYRATPQMAGSVWSQDLNTFNQAMFSPALSSLRAQTSYGVTNYYNGNTLVYTKRPFTGGNFYYNAAGNLIAVERGNIATRGYILNRKLTRQVSFDITDADGKKDSTVTFTVQGCGGQNGLLELDKSGNVIQSFDSNNRPTHGYLDRLSSLKIGLIGLLADGTRLAESNKIAIGTFPYGDTAKMDKSAQPLTLARRKELISYIFNLQASGGTPSAQAYATAGAYLMGSTPGNVNNGDPFYWSASETKQGSVYKSPIDNASCDGYGVYFMTDGEPNLNNDRAQTMMRNSLSNRFNSYMTCGSTIISSSQAGVRTLSDLGTAYEKPAQGGALNTGRWDCLGTYSQLLYDANYNTTGKRLKTATVGFGGIFNGFSNKTYKYIDGIGQNRSLSIPDCDTAPNQDAKNLCLLGSLDANFGRGGFTSTGDPAVLAESVVKFFEQLGSIIPTAPAGTISIPSDPLSASNLQPYAYLPMIQPEVDATLTTWDGNLKKYHTLQGTLFGQDKKRLYQKATNATTGNVNFPSKLNPETRDIWQEADYNIDNKVANDKVAAGGSKNKLLAPTSKNDNNIRTVYLETTKNNQRVLQKVGVSGGQLTGFNQLGGEYNIVDMAYVLNLLGFAVPVDEKIYKPNGSETMATQLTNLQNQLDNAATTGIKALGGVAHSVPVLVAYSGEFDSNGNVVSDESKRNDRLLYGSMDGVVHMIQARTGEESFSFIPRATFDDTEQRHALLPGSNYSQIGGIDGKKGQPKFGVDGPWSVNAEYGYNDNDITAKKMYVYGGMRMGGVGLYGLNVSNPNAPELAFSINDKTPGFGRLGQTWAKPLVATIKTGSKSTDTKKVLIVGGGYDMCYENPLFKLNDANSADPNCRSLTQTKGNAVYMLDAQTGALLNSWTSTSGGDAQYMKHSIVSEIVPADRNSNGAVDHLYFSDLGGQVFRIDLKEGVSAGSMSRRVVRIFDANEGVTTANHIPYRFYEKPSVSIYNMGNSRVAMIAISSGDRSSPTHKRRDLADANRIYGIVDRDVATSRAATGQGLISQNLKTSNLQFYDTATLEKATNAQRLEYINKLKTGQVQGWYYTMTRFDKYEGVKNLKGIGSNMTMGSIYYTSVYNPEYRYTTLGNTCEAEILGGTERQMFCMPWGICANINTGALIKESKNGTLGYSKAGPGIQEIGVGTVTNTEGKSTNITTIVGAASIAENNDQSQDDSTDGQGAFTGENGGGQLSTSGGNKPPSAILKAENTVFKVKRWYDLQNAEDTN